MIAQFDPKVLGEIDPEECAGFGMRDSHVYRDMFFRLTKNMSVEDRTWVLTMAVAIKNKERILLALNTSFQGARWKGAVQQFYMNHTVTKNSDITAGRDVIPVVNIPGCVPPMTALIWRSMQRAENLTYDSFVENQWVAQIKVSEEVLSDQKKWEMDLWNNKIKSGGARYTPGFKEEFWLTKTRDNYPLLDKDMQPFKPNKAYEKADIEEWLAMQGGGDMAAMC